MGDAPEAVPVSAAAPAASAVTACLLPLSTNAVLLALVKPPALSQPPSLESRSAR